MCIRFGYPPQNCIVDYFTTMPWDQPKILRTWLQDWRLLKEGKQDRDGFLTKTKHYGQKIQPYLKLREKKVTSWNPTKKRHEKHVMKPNFLEKNVMRSIIPPNFPPKQLYVHVPRSSYLATLEGQPGCLSCVPKRWVPGRREAPSVGPRTEKVQRRETIRCPSTWQYLIYSHRINVCYACL